MRKGFFREAGQIGGRKRAKNLSSRRRSEIAARAAAARWKKPGSKPLMMESVRFDTPVLDDPAYLEEVLVDGSLKDWSCLYEEISDRPFGAAASALKSVLSSTSHYGVTPLWTGILRNVRGGA